MPFEYAIPRMFTPAAIREYAPVASGVFGISNSSEWIYIGETDNIQGSLLQLTGESNTAFQSRRPTGFVYEICDVAGRYGRQDRLVREYEPSCNRREGQNAGGRRSNGQG